MIRKQVLMADRVRRPPREGWSWIDRRFLREHAPRLSHEAIFVYLFLAAVSDQKGLSFYNDVDRRPPNGRAGRGPRGTIGREDRYFWALAQCFRCRSGAGPARRLRSG
jgi:hypothetical protein